MIPLDNFQFAVAICMSQYISVDIHFILLYQFDGDKEALLLPKARHALLCYQLFCYQFHNS